ncbi:MAG: ABC transporter ATP-binding protein [Alphaproteobacteria bacterium]|nr:ABC transporter ATP-binding protein [Alphaproteobacteria bacterium]
MRIEKAAFGYDKRKLILRDFDYTFRRGKITAIVGPNGCGKSTLLGLCTKMYKPTDGAVYLDGKSIAKYKGKDFAKYVASVYQVNEMPSDLSVHGLVAFGRTPHRKPFGFLSESDEAVISYSIEKTHLKGFEARRISDLSGGERQRAYLAMALTQEPKILFLDEPTTFLDVYFQIEIMEIVAGINSEKGVTVIMALHDLNQAVKYADDIIVMKNGQIAASGAAKATLTSELICSVFGVNAEVMKTENGDNFYAIYR